MNARNNNDDDIETVDAPIVSDLTDEKKQEYADFFRHCIARKQTKEIKDKLRESAPYRSNLMQHFGQDFKQYCQFYFDMPELVSQNKLTPYFFSSFVILLSLNFFIFQ